MDQKLHEGEQTVMEHKSMLPTADKSSSEPSSTPIKKPQIQATKHLDANLVFPTPEKTYETLNIRRQMEPAKLPEKYRILSELFGGMTTSLRLLDLHKKSELFDGMTTSLRLLNLHDTFLNISRRVEKLRGRKLSYSHLAQMKFILPEAVQTNRILLQNNKTCCMEPEIQVTLLLDVTEGHVEVEDSAYIALDHIFFSRLLKFVNTHSEGCDVPEAELPWPFNQKKITPKSFPVDSSMEKLQNIDELDLAIPSQLPSYFSRHFSKKGIEESKKTELSSSPVLTCAIETYKEAGCGSCLDLVKHEEKLEAVNTPMKPPLLSVETPDLSTPKRSLATEDDKVSQHVMASSSIAKRSLNFSKAEDESIGTSENNAITLSGLKAHQDTSNDLSDLVETIYIIQSQCCFITKRELVHKILANNLDITEVGEIEEQLDLLVNKVPEWISKKVAPSGDLLYNINKGLDLKYITGKFM